MKGVGWVKVNVSDIIWDSKKNGLPSETVIEDISSDVAFDVTGGFEDSVCEYLEEEHEVCVKNFTAQRVIDFEVTIYVDVLSMFYEGLSDKSIKGRISHRLSEDEWILDDVRAELEEMLDDIGAEDLSVLKKLDEIVDFDDWFNFDRAGADIDWSETNELCDHSLVAFRIPCEFIVDGLLK